jgi:hypothetical protein
MEMIAMLNGLGATPRTAMDYLDQGLSRTIASSQYNPRLAGIPMSPEQAMMAARANTIADHRYSVNQLGALPVSAREYAIESGMDNVTSGAMWARNRAGSLAGLGAAPTSPWLLALGMLGAFAAIGYVFAGEKFGK